MNKILWSEVARLFTFLPNLHCNIPHRISLNLCSSWLRFLTRAIITLVNSRLRGGALERESDIPNFKCLDPLVLCFILLCCCYRHTNFRSIREFNCCNSAGNMWQPLVLLSNISSSLSGHMEGLQFFAPLNLRVAPWFALVSEMLSGSDVHHVWVEALSISIHQPANSRECPPYWSGCWGWTDVKEP